MNVKYIVGNCIKCSSYGVINNHNKLCLDCIPIEKVINEQKEKKYSPMLKVFVFNLFYNNRWFIDTIHIIARTRAESKNKINMYIRNCVYEEDFHNISFEPITTRLLDRYE